MTHKTGGSIVLFLDILGIFSSLQRHIYIPSRTANAHKRAILRNLQTLLLLLSKNSWRFTNGTHSSNNLCNDYILDGRSQAIFNHISLDPYDCSLQCSSGSRRRASLRSNLDGCEKSSNIIFGVNASVLTSRRLLYPAYTGVHRMVEIYFF